ncbi:TPA: hypothetical protein N0F65_002280 [Lagenidium giganteum]|uniref:Uncharacterized protein n=1 Tax=Lagenidium giganteum TaxID=4803 RepID=A0AAV2YPE0_9STRA|nr:TPA: hypothetical protein N0F65_002280 [Lagenidium giganteum]
MEATMLPLYRRTMRFISDPYMRMKKQAVVASIMALFLLYVLLVGVSDNYDNSVLPLVTPTRFQPTTPLPAQPIRPMIDTATGAVSDAPGLRGAAAPDVRPALEPEPAMPAPRVPSRNTNVHANAAAEEPVAGAIPPTRNNPLILRLLLPLLAGFCFGFLGSVPIAGPTSAMVLKLGIQGKYQAGLTIAFGGALSEATYAGIAFWGFGSFLAGAKFLLPVSKVLGAVMFTIVGMVFLRSDMRPPMESETESSSGKGIGRARDEIIKNVLMGVTMSGINPALLATYTGAIASVYGTGMLEFTLFLAFVFAMGVCCGVSTWFYLLLSLLKKYKQRLKNQTIGIFMRCMGGFLLTLGLMCAKSSIEYFFFNEAK